jgi:hypothetical protein
MEFSTSRARMSDFFVWFFLQLSQRGKRPGAKKKEEHL